MIQISTTSLVGLAPTGQQVPPVEAAGVSFADFFSEAIPDEPRPPKSEDSETPEAAAETPEILALALPMPFLWQKTVVISGQLIAGPRPPPTTFSVENVITPSMQPTVLPSPPGETLTDSEPAPFRLSDGALLVQTPSQAGMPSLQTADEDVATSTKPDSLGAIDPGLPPPFETPLAPQLGLASTAPVRQPLQTSAIFPESAHHETNSVRLVPAKIAVSLPPQAPRQPALPMAQIAAATQPIDLPEQSHPAVPPPQLLAHPTVPTRIEPSPEPTIQSAAAPQALMSPEPAMAPDLEDSDTEIPPIEPGQDGVPIAQWGIDAALLPQFAPPALAQIGGASVALPLMPMQLPKPLAPTLAKIARDTNTGAVELSLAPAELGRLHMTFVHDGDQVRVTLTAERPETLDLLRRNADQLAQEFRQAGFAGSTLNFGQWGSGHSGPHQPPQDPNTTPSAAAPTLGNLPQNIAPAPVLSGSGLDLRL